MVGWNGTQGHSGKWGAGSVLHGGEGNCVGVGWVGGGGGILNCQEESLLGTLKTLRISLRKGLVHIRAGGLYWPK